MQGEDLQQGAKEYAVSYLREVLGLADEAREEEIDDRLVAEAKELGLDIVWERSSEHKGRESISTLPLEAPRRSSIDSRASMAASMVSDASADSSRVRNSNGGTRSRASLSFRDRESHAARTRPEGRASMSFSLSKTPSASTSNFSLPLSTTESSPKKHYRLMRGLGMLRLSRADSVAPTRGCPHCPRDVLSQRRAVHQLPCGHRLCTQALRDTIKSATLSKDGAIPSCCAVPVPGNLIDHVMMQQEQNIILGNSQRRDGSTSAAPSAKSEASEARALRRPTTSRNVSDESKVDSVAPRNKPDQTDTEEHPDIRQLRQLQAELEGRCLDWIERNRSQLASKHDRLRRDLKTRHERAAASLQDRHAHAMSEAEDNQVRAEADMRSSHAQEERDSATALKHMEAYCAGGYVSTGEPHGRTITEQDRAGLKAARRMRDGMSGRHKNAINVLRGEQARRLRAREQRQEKEAHDLQRSQASEELELERTWTEELRGFEDFVEARQAALKYRWGLEVKILEKKIEAATGIDACDNPPTTESAPLERGPQAESGAEAECVA